MSTAAGRKKLFFNLQSSDRRNIAQIVAIREKWCPGV
jgi:hypothetical protein